MKCSRPKCVNTAKRRGLCVLHASLNPDHRVDAQPVRDHVKRLRKEGMSWREIAQQSQMCENGLRWPGTAVRASTAARILAIPEPDGYTGCGWVPAVGPRRRIQALAAIGWPQRTIAELAGLKQSNLYRLMRPGSRVSGLTAKRIADVYDELCMTVGPSGQSKMWARRSGWVPPLAWTDIDDPDEIPDVGRPRRVSFPERYAEFRELGLSDEEAAARLGISRKSLERQLLRFGLRGAA